MWKCPKCGREFQRVNQGHYCGAAPADVEAYIDAQQPEAQAHLRSLRDIIRSSVPDASERIAWSMPVYTREKRTVSFAACKRHVSLYTDTSVLETFKAEIADFEVRKNAIYLPYGKALPAAILSDMVKACLNAT